MLPRSQTRRPRPESGVAISPPLKAAPRFRPPDAVRRRRAPRRGRRRHPNFSAPCVKNSRLRLSTLRTTASPHHSIHSADYRWEPDGAVDLLEDDGVAAHSICLPTYAVGTCRRARGRRHRAHLARTSRRKRQREVGDFAVRTKHASSTARRPHARRVDWRRRPQEVTRRHRRAAAGDARFRAPLLFGAADKLLS